MSKAKELLSLYEYEQAFKVEANGKIVALVATKKEAAAIVKERSAEGDGLDKYKVSKVTASDGEKLPKFFD